MSGRKWVIWVVGATIAGGAIAADEADLSLLGKQTRAFAGERARRGSKRPALRPSASAAAAATLPDGLSFELRAVPQMGHNGPTGAFDWRLRLAGNEAALRTVRRVVYTLPKEHFALTTITGSRENGFLIDGDCPNVDWEVRARVQLADRTVEQTIPFRRR